MLKMEGMILEVNAIDVILIGKENHHLYVYQKRQDFHLLRVGCVFSKRALMKQWATTRRGKNKGMGVYLQVLHHVMKLLSFVEWF